MFALMPHILLWWFDCIAWSYPTHIGKLYRLYVGMDIRNTYGQSCPKRVSNHATPKSWLSLRSAPARFDPSSFSQLLHNKEQTAIQLCPSTQSRAREQKTKIRDWPSSAASVG
ncbi:hypothetical protein F4861DRAFT_21744 [Xylaria intraflava]|nr:hypothetical protein F4861DRAFT_21744 [Xylaria intraflava]